MLEIVMRAIVIVLAWWACRGHAQSKRAYTKRLEVSHDPNLKRPARQQSREIIDMELESLRDDRAWRPIQRLQHKAKHLVESKNALTTLEHALNPGQHSLENDFSEDKQLSDVLRALLLALNPLASVRTSSVPFVSREAGFHMEQKSASEESDHQWFVEVPASFPGIVKQVARSVRSALTVNRRVIVEVEIPELHIHSQYYREELLSAFVVDLAESVLLREMPPSSPKVKLLYASTENATIPGAMIMNPSFPVSILGCSSSISPYDGAFVVVAPSYNTEYDVDRALESLLQKARDRPVIVVNPSMADSPFLKSMESAYLLRQFSMNYIAEPGIKHKLKRANACLLHCHPHEWSVILDVTNPVTRNADRTQKQAGNERTWRWLGGFDGEPQRDQVESLLQSELNNLRNDEFRSGPDGSSAF